MKYKDVTEILNNQIFSREKRNLIQRIATNPERYTGIFRPTKPKAKLIQNLSQSHEIRFGDALEQLIREIISERKFTNLPRELRTSDGKRLSVDQLFTDGKRYYFMEQKIRDDHDSTKKRGQIKNFETKLDLLYKMYAKNLTGIIFFIDPNLSKNKNYYTEELERIKKHYRIDLFLFYGQDFFDFIDQPNLWGDLTYWIKQWKNNLPDSPEIDFDYSPKESFDKIKTLKPIYWKKLLANESIWDEGIIKVLFSNGSTLKLLFGYFSQKKTSEYQNLANSLLERINEFYY